MRDAFEAASCRSSIALCGCHLGIGGRGEPGECAALHSGSPEISLLRSTFTNLVRGSEHGKPH